MAAWECAGWDWRCISKELRVAMTIRKLSPDGVRSVVALGGA